VGKTGHRKSSKPETGGKSRWGVSAGIWCWCGRAHGRAAADRRGWVCKLSLPLKVSCLPRGKPGRQKGSRCPLSRQGHFWEPVQMLAATWLAPTAPRGNWLERWSSGTGNRQGEEGNSRAMPTWLHVLRRMLFSPEVPLHAQVFSSWSGGETSAGTCGARGGSSGRASYQNCLGSASGCCRLPMVPLQCPQPSFPGPPRTDCVCFSSARSLD